MAYCIHALAKRLSKTRNWIVKSFIFAFDFLLVSKIFCEQIRALISINVIIYVWLCDIGYKLIVLIAMQETLNFFFILNECVCVCVFFILFYFFYNLI